LPCRCGRSCCNKRGVMRSKKGWPQAQWITREAGRKDDESVNL
jgi:hypothetical protein